VLEESWVLGITATSGQLEFEMDLVFAKDHPDLRSPRDGEVFYSRTGVLHFRGDRLDALRGKRVSPGRKLGSDDGEGDGIEAELTGAAD
jgi:hypothetical protein